MSEPQHSPGPWSVEQDDIGWESILSAGKGNVAEMAGIQGSPGKPSANARLIAAAPDMLRLLRVLAAKVDNTEHPDDCEVEYCAALNEAYDLIARLDGGE